MLVGGGLLKQSLLYRLIDGLFCAEKIKLVLIDEIMTSSNLNLTGDGTNPANLFSSVLLMIQSSQFALSSL